MTAEFDPVFFVLPAYDPDEKMLSVVRELAEKKPDHTRILIVDDGSTTAHRNTVFAPLADLPDVTILHHDVNRGKGAALKTAFQFILAQQAPVLGCVTADCDGQHSVSDMLQAATILRQNPDSLVLGCRHFADDLPWKSRLGNRLTKWIFRALLCRPISDTQTGLRGIPASLMRSCLAIRYNHFEFETQMLLATAEGHFVEFPIRTIYFNQNAGTHFRPVKDALRIYRVILCFFFNRIGFFFLSSLSAYCIDLGIFSLLFYWLLPHSMAYPLPWAGRCDLRLFCSCIAARILSSIWNFAINRMLVFGKKRGRDLWQDVARYYLLAACIMLLSWSLLEVATIVTGERFAAVDKVLIDAVLFLISYTVQRNHIFNRSR